MAKVHCLESVGHQTLSRNSDPWRNRGPTPAPVHQGLMLAVLGGLADVERDLIRTRTAEGRSRAKAQGKRMGRRVTERGHQTARARRDVAGIGRTATTAALPPCASREPNPTLLYRCHQHALKTRSAITISHCSLFLSFGLKWDRRSAVKSSSERPRQPVCYAGRGQHDYGSRSAEGPFPPASAQAHHCPRL